MIPRDPQPLAPLDVPLTGTMLVEASAGTGKTHAITTLFVRLVVEEGLSVREVLVVTFTEAATAELRERVRRRLRRAVDVLSGKIDGDRELTDLAIRATKTANVPLYYERAVTALRELDLAAISTIHAFCMRMLQEHAFESGARFDLALASDTRLLVDEVANDYWAKSVYGLASSLFALRAGAFERKTSHLVISAVAKRPADAVVLPAPVACDVDALAARVQAPYDAARTIWARDARAIQKLLLESDALNRNAYAVKMLAGLFAELDTFFAPASPVAARPEKLAKLTPSELASGTKQKKVTPEHAFFGACEDLVAALDGATADLALALRRGAVDFVRAELPKRKDALRAQGFEDLLFALDAALAGPRGDALTAGIRGRYRAALLDEFQDTDPVQYRIFHRIFHGASTLLLVGDPKQSIYAFRGADVFSYVDAVSDAANAQHTLGENWRSDPSLVRAVNTLFERAPDPFRLSQIAFKRVVAHAEKDRITVPGSAAAFEVLFLPREGPKPRIKGWLTENLPRLVAGEVARFLRAGATLGGGRPVVPGDIAVLTRTNAEARATQAELRKLGIPTALQSDESVFASEEAAEVESLLRAILEPTQSRAVRTALATTVAGVSADAIAALDTDERAWDAWSGRFRAWQAHWDDHGFLQAYRRMLTDLGAEKRLLALVDGERRMTNLLHLGELVHGVATRERLGRTAVVRWLGLTRALVANGETQIAETESTELRLESDAHAVKLLTIHKSKGLEFPIVYCPFLYGCRLPEPGDVAIDFHDPADGFRSKLDIAPEEASLAQKAAEVLAENQRLLYVALTRAKHRCSIVWGAFNEAEDCALAYTLHGGAARYKGRDDADLRADLDALAVASEGAIAVVPLDPAARGERWSPPVKAGDGQALAARAFTRERVDRWFRMGSFTALTRGAGGDAPAIDPEAQGRDHDEVEERTSLLPAPPEASSEPVPMHAFPRGAKAGTTLHAVLEVVDFQSKDEAALRALVTTKMTEAGYTDAGHIETLARGVRAMLDTPLDASGVTLSSIPRAKRADELAFVFPVVREGGVLSAGKVADAFDAHASPAVHGAYGMRLRSLRFLPLRGFLKGFIDLVFEHEGRFYVVDYKSNHLGERAEDYRASCLVKAMTHHDYYLQYHLYMVAVHRWLRARVRGYDYDTHVGGVFYLFARGMNPLVPGSGVFADRPSRALVEALSEAMDG